MGLCLTYHVNLKLSTRQTAHALAEIHSIKISHTMVANYALTAATVIKPFVDTFDYRPSNILSVDETYIKVKGIRHYVWIVMDACKKSILGYHIRYPTQGLLVHAYSLCGWLLVNFKAFLVKC